MRPNASKKSPASKKDAIIGVSGAPGSFSEEAAQHFVHAAGLKVSEIQYLVTVEAVLAALEEGSCTLGVFPVANSIGGIVLEAVYAMANHNFFVEKIFQIEIHQNLLILPGTKAGDITQILSHDQALKQCKSYLSRVWPAVKIKEYSDTAKAAEDLASGLLPPTSGAIASKAAAKLYKLEILEASIQDLKTNYTTFVAARKHK